MSTKIPSPQGISRLLKDAGFKRSAYEGRSGASSGYRVGKAYTSVILQDGTVIEAEKAVKVTHHFWSMGGTPSARYRQELERYAPVIEAAGYRTEIQNGGRDLLVVAKEG
jgi:hypothetical protein